MNIIHLQKKYSKLEIDELLGFVLNKPKEFLLMKPDYKLSSYQVKKLSRLIKRRESGEPLAYLLGHKDFYGLRFRVNKDVLIPRPETEWIVDRVLSFIASQPRLGNKGGALRILDIGTGSGCIPISFAKNISISKYLNIKITATDISPAALKVAKQNAKNILKYSYPDTALYQGKNIKFVKSDLFKNLNGKFDIITANLPYVPLKMLHKFMHHNTKLKADDQFAGLKFEPSFALTDGTSSWQIYRRFFREVGQHLNLHSIVLLETDPASKKFLKEYQEKYLPNFKMKFYKDYNNLFRFVEIRRK